MLQTVSVAVYVVGLGRLLGRYSTDLEAILIT